MPPTLSHAFTLRAYVSHEHAISVKTVKGGPQRMSIPIQSGYLHGSGIEAEIIPGGADWPVAPTHKIPRQFIPLDPTASTLHIGARLNLKTSTGEAIYIQHSGVLKIDEKSKSNMGPSKDAKSTQFGDHELFVTPVIETSDASLKWVEAASLVAEGRWIVEERKKGVEYEVYVVRSSGE
ncbi:hypothetical protein DOTSEDRAFT_57681 [Dothistroma septosporum NZE10]|uniref:Uncharacterized protein n=1 Tax=Dothistroma septosporum (strain NZE10 / CBS 128990) TaxID=675120 RepID=M2XZR6_DOTSN|nr:hypothetical protein DOTSEDRAFT_57681 [Dothistroma septosporum NZE10]